ncbi:MAG: HpcH/HpaI aldolase family protein [Promethearchaeota archaeon]
MLKEKIKKGKEIFGTMIQDFNTPLIIPLLNKFGFDFIVLDQEHAPINFKDIQNFVLAAKDTGIAVITRVSRNSQESISRVMDMGVDGVMVPHVDTLTDAKAIIKSVKYPPVGERSYGIRRILSRFQTSSSSEFIKKSNIETIIFIQSESRRSIHNIDDILSIDEIDGVIAGPADYTMNLGKIGKYNDKEFENGMEIVLKSCQKKGKHFGIHFSNLKLLKYWRKKGMNILLHGTIKTLVQERCEEILAELKLG